MGCWGLTGEIIEHKGPHRVPGSNKWLLDDYMAAQKQIATLGYPQTPLDEAIKALGAELDALRELVATQAGMMG